MFYLHVIVAYMTLNTLQQSATALNDCKLTRYDMLFALTAKKDMRLRRQCLLSDLTYNMILRPQNTSHTVK